MPNPPNPTDDGKAKLIELTDDGNGGWKPKTSGGKTVSAQFNPESLKITYTNQVKWPRAGDQRGTSPIQFVGSGTTKLTATLWFDSSTAGSSASGASDVRAQTQDVAYFMKPDTSNSKKFVARAVRFQWGNLTFDGIMDSLDQTLDFFAPDGTPIRASLNFGISRNQITILKGQGSGASPGTTPKTPAPQGSSMQQVAATQGLSNNWQSIAAANGIENPRQLVTGQLMDMSAGGVSAGASLGLSASFGASASSGFGGGLSAGFGGGVTGALSTGGSVGVSAGVSVGASIGIGGSIGVGGSVGAGGSISVGASAGVSLGAGGGAAATIGF
jgi:hypothetical protein